MDELELLEDAVVGQDVHGDAPDDANASRQKSKEEISSHSRGNIQHHFSPLSLKKKTLKRSGVSVFFLFLLL